MGGCPPRRDQRSLLALPVRVLERAEWVFRAIPYALKKVISYDLDVQIVSYRSPSRGLLGFNESIGQQHLGSDQRTFHPAKTSYGNASL